MFHPKLRRVVASAVLMSSLSLLSVQSVNAAPRVRRAQERTAFSERIERWGLRAWDFLAGLLEKRSVMINPDGVQAVPGGDDGH